MMKNFKRISAVLLAAMMIVSACACQQKKEEESESTPTNTGDADATSGTVVGGWTLDNANGAGLDEEETKVFEAAVGTLTGVGYEALTCVATQVVAGTNYAFLCKGTTVTETPVTDIYLVYVYSGVDGTIEVLDIKPLEDCLVEEAEVADVDLVGGWTVTERDPYAPDSIDADLLNKAVGELTGATYDLLAMLGTQVVAGTNYSYICRQTMVTENPVTNLVKVVVYNDLEDNASITSISYVKLGVE